MIHDCSLLEGADGRAPRLCQRLIQIFAAESGDLHFVQPRPIQAFILAVQGEVQQVVVWKHAKVTIDPQPAVGGRQTEDFLPLHHEPHRPARGDAVLHHTHASEEIVGGSGGLEVRQQHDHHRVLRNRMTDRSEIGVHLSLKNGTATEQEKQNTKEGPVPFPCLHPYSPLSCSAVGTGR